MMWLLAAAIGHMLNGAAFIIDKMLMSQAFKRGATYAGMLGIISFLGLLAAPWVDRWPHGEVWIEAMLSGVLFVFALWGFFTALGEAEASRVVPIVGSIIPLITLLGALALFHERLTLQQGIGFICLIIATIVLSSTGGRFTMPSSARMNALGAAILFALSSLFAKSVYVSVGFLSGLVSTRLGAGLAGVLIFGVLDPEARKEALAVMRPKKADARSRSAVRANSRWLGLASQVAGSGGFLLVQYAIAAGSVTIVNVLQAVQYAFIVLVAVLLRRRAPQLLREHVGERVLRIKVAAVALTVLGLVLVRV